MDYFSSNQTSVVLGDLAEEPPSPLDSPLEVVELQEAGRAGEKEEQPQQESAPERQDMDKRDSSSTPPAIASVVREERLPPPANPRFLHGGPPLSDLCAPSVIIPAISGTPTVTASSWRAFTDEEERRLQGGWRALESSKASGEDKGLSAESDVDADSCSDPYIIPVGLDFLFSVNLRNLVLVPDFWAGTPVRVLLSLWFYAPPRPSSRPSHLIKCYPVDPALALALEKAYHEIKPWESSYEAELQSALRVGVSAEAKLRVPLIREAGQGLECIFQDAETARVYSTGIVGSMGKSFLSSGKAHGGGQVVLRGWDAVRAWKKKKAAVDGDEGHRTPTKRETSASETDDGEASPVPRSRTTSSSSPLKPSQAPPGFFSALKTKIGVVAAVVEGASEEELVETDGNDTQEAMAGPRKRKDGENEVDEDVEKVGEVDELVLVIHGIGQKLAGTYKSLSFVHAVNDLRTNCTTLSTSSIAPLIHSKRAQFIPVQWRTDLEFEDELDSGADQEDESLGNRFNLEDIEIKDSVPVLRQIVNGLVLDVPFYLSSHKEKMIRAVVRDANRIYRLFSARNPGFNGRVSIIAHSLGSALAADILSSQPTFVKPLSQMSLEEKSSEKQFVFDTRVLILVGSPLAFFLHLGKGQLIARRGRERTKDVPRDIALDRAGRYGCMAADSVYNVYHQTDPVAFALNATVDVAYSRQIKPIAIPSTNITLLQNLSDTYNRVSRLFDVSTLWSSADPASAEVVEEKVLEEKASEEKKVRKEKGPPTSAKPMRPGGMKRMPSEKPMGKEEFVKVDRAERRFKALNPQGCVDFFLPAEGLNQYVEALSSHGSYWYDQRFATFVLTQLFASSEDLERTGREEIGTED